MKTFVRYSDLESRMKDELMNVKIKFTEQSQTVAELKQEISRLETKVCIYINFAPVNLRCKSILYFIRYGHF